MNRSNEIVAGITTFLASAYIVVVNPGILSAAGMPFPAVVTATVLVTAFSSVMMGLYAKNPILIAPGMGLNAFFTYSVVVGMGVTWQTALGAVFISGIIFICLSIFNIREQIVKAIPKPLRFAVTAGIGLFITLIGVTKAGFTVPGSGTIMTFGGVNTSVLVFVVGLFLTAVLVVLRVKGAFLLGILLTTLVSIPVSNMLGAKAMVRWEGFIAMPDFSLFWAMDVVSAMQLSIWPVIFAFLFTDMFDSLSTFVGVAEAGDLLDSEGEPMQLRESLIVDGLATMLSGIFGTSPGTSYIESAAGIQAGGRTGLTAIVAGLLFLPLMFFAPLLSLIPDVAIAPVLVLVGLFMIAPIEKINWSQMEEAIPAFLAMVLIPYTYSITQGLIWGFLAWTAMQIVVGKGRVLPKTLLVIDIIAVFALLI
jgi:AGZA family xanthine/uracil permease-like MFS transporter